MSFISFQFLLNFPTDFDCFPDIFFWVFCQRPFWEFPQSAMWERQNAVHCYLRLFSFSLVNQSFQRFITAASLLCTFEFVNIIWIVRLPDSYGSIQMIDTTPGSHNFTTQKYHVGIHSHTHIHTTPLHPFQQSNQFKDLSCLNSQYRRRPLHCSLVPEGLYINPAWLGNQREVSRVHIFSCWSMRLARRQD